MTRRQVAITGIGLISPLATGTQATWERIIRGESGIGPITQFDTTNFATTIAGECSDFNPEAFMPRKLTRQMDRFIQLGVAAAQLAVEDSGLKIGEAAGDEPPSVDPERVGCYVGAGLGGISTIEATHDTLREKGPRHGISPFFVPAIIVNLVPGQISIKYNCKGPSFAVVSACSTGAHSIGEAARAIERGDADVMFAGGAESTVSPLSIGGFNSARALSTRNDDPTGASRPFSRDRDGFVLSEGAGVLILEELEHAKARGAHIYATLAGYSANSDAFHITAPSPEGEGAQRCMRLALKDAGIAPEQVGYVNAHGTSTIADAIETRAIRGVFGDHAYNGLTVSSTKSMHGHLLGAAGGLEAGICALALDRGVLPPTINLKDPDPECDLDYIPNVARERQVEIAVSNSFGFGGTNACMVLRRYDA